MDWTENGCISEERSGPNKLFSESFIDAYRQLYPDEKNAFTWWSKGVSYFQAVITVKCLLTSGVGTVTEETTDGLKRYTADCAAGNTTITVTAARTYNIKI